MASTSAAAGSDGQYRMTIDSSYEQLAALRNSAKVLYPIFMAVSLGKVAWIVLPQLSRNQTADTLGTAVFCLGCGGGVVAWLMAGLGTRYEHFGSVMLFNVLTACAIIFHTVSRAKAYVTPPERRPPHSHSDVAAAALVQQFPALQQSLDDVRQFIQALEYVVDVGMVLVGVPLCVVLHLYIMQKKKLRHGVKKTS